jgi:hypothetical protein
LSGFVLTHTNADHGVAAGQHQAAGKWRLVQFTDEKNKIGVSQTIQLFDGRTLRSV